GEVIDRSSGSRAERYASARKDHRIHRHRPLSRHTHTHDRGQNHEPHHVWFAQLIIISPGGALCQTGFHHVVKLAGWRPKGRIVTMLMHAVTDRALAEKICGGNIDAVSMVYLR
ncbi:hypothetical protein, partial [Porticoccus sp.]